MYLNVNVKPVSEIGDKWGKSSVHANTKVGQSVVLTYSKKKKKEAFPAPATRWRPWRERRASRLAHCGPRTWPELIARNIWTHETIQRLHTAVDGNRPAERFPPGGRLCLLCWSELVPAWAFFFFRLRTWLFLVYDGPLKDIDPRRSYVSNSMTPHYILFWQHMPLRRWSSLRLLLVPLSLFFYRPHKESDPELVVCGGFFCFFLMHYIVPLHANVCM